MAVEIDFDKVKELVACGKSAAEIAAELGVGKRTIQRRCAGMLGPQGARFVEIDLDKVERLSMLGCSADEIAAELGVSERTIWRRCGAILARGTKRSHVRLRSALMKYALAGNPALLVFLAKSVLGLREPRDDDGFVLQNNLVITISQSETRQIEAAAEPVRHSVREMFARYKPLPSNGDAKPNED